MWCLLLPAALTGAERPVLSVGGGLLVAAVIRGSDIEHVADFSICQSRADARLNISKRVNLGLLRGLLTMQTKRITEGNCTVASSSIPAFPN